VHDHLALRGRAHFVSHVRDVLRLRRIVREGGYRLVHCHGTWDHIVGYWGVKGRRKQVRIVRTDHGAREYRRGYWQSFYYGPQMTDHLIVLSGRFAAQAADRLGRDSATITVLRGGIDTERWRPVDPPEGVRQRLGVTDEDVLIGVVARVQRHRRFDVLLDAAHVVEQRDPRVKVLVLGRGTHKKSVLDRPIRRLGLEGTVLPLGYRTDDYVDILATLDAGLMLVPGSDGSCRAAIQMAAMGKPLIVAERGVLPDIVRDGETGIVLDDTPEALAAAMLDVASAPERRRRWGLAARERICRWFSLEGEAEGVAAVYRHVLQESAR